MDRFNKEKKQLMYEWLGKNRMIKTFDGFLLQSIRQGIEIFDSQVKTLKVDQRQCGGWVNTNLICR